MATTWNKTNERNKLARAGFNEASDFWSWREGIPIDSPEVLSAHHGYFSKKLLRQTLVLRLDDATTYYVKFFRDGAFQHLLDEFDAFEVIPEFDLITPEVVASDFNHNRKRGFIVLGELKGFVSLREVAKGKTSREMLEHVQKFKNESLDKIVEAFMKIWKAGYFYPDWRDKHIFVNPMKRQVGLIDLERFLHVSKCPWHYRFKISGRRLKKREFNRLLNAFSLDVARREELEARFDDA